MSADLDSLDPDKFYSFGFPVMLSVYEGLVTYAPGDLNEVVGQLAESWSVSGDGLVYTFKLRDGVRFHSGAPLTSEDVKRSLERRASLNAGPSWYVAAYVDSIETPDPQTVVVTLKFPDYSWLQLIAGPWGPKIVGPGALVDNAGNDNAQSYLKTHDDGTGPFSLDSVTRGQSYVLKRFDDYWGGTPAFAKAVISITPDISSQILQFRGGDLDAVLQGFPRAQIPSISGSAKVNLFPSDSQLFMSLNPSSVFADKRLREALLYGLDPQSWLPGLYGETGELATSMYPPLVLSGVSDFSYPTDVGRARDLVAQVGGRPVVQIAYLQDEVGQTATVAETIASRLNDLGFDASTKAVSVSEQFGWPQDLASAPDAYLATTQPEGAHPDQWARVIWYTNGAINTFRYSNSQVDGLIDQGTAIPPDNADKLATVYGKAGDLVAADLFFLPLMDVKDLIVVQRGLEVQHVPVFSYTFNLGTARYSG